MAAASISLLAACFDCTGTIPVYMALTSSFQTDRHCGGRSTGYNLSSNKTTFESIEKKKSLTFGSPHFQKSHELLRIIILTLFKFTGIL